MPDELSLPHLIDRLVPDAWRNDHPFSEHFSAPHKALCAAESDSSRAEVLGDWLYNHQPCLFGRAAARQSRIEFCFLSHDDLLTGDDHTAGRIAAARLRWRRKARKGETSAFVVLVISELVALAEPNSDLLALSRRLAELYLCRDVQPDRIVHDELFLETAESRSWKVGANFFAAQGEGRWWKDHRIPGGIALSMNSVGHLACVNRIGKNAFVKDQRYGLDSALLVAMKLIDGTSAGPSGRDTELHEVADRAERVECLVHLPNALAGKNRCEYAGLYHTDQTLPSAYFSPAEFRPDAPRIEDLDLTYLHHDSPENPDYRAMGLGLPQE